VEQCLLDKLPAERHQHVTPAIQVLRPTTSIWMPTETCY
jgi:hypothetical protein